MAFDGITTKLVINELKQTIIGSRIEKIYVPTHNEVWLNFHTLSRKSVKLLISIDANNCRLHLSAENRSNPEKAPNFCMVLRKYLSGAKLLDIKQTGLDRIITLTLENIDDFGDLVTKELVIELMGKYSNIILLNNDTIIDSIRHVDITMSSVREVLPSRKYIMPTSLGKSEFQEISKESFCKIIEENINSSAYEDVSLPNVLSNCFVGFSKSFTNAICEELSICNMLSKDEVSSEMLEKIYNKLSKLIEDIEANKISLRSNASGKDYSICENNDEKKDFEISEFLDNFYSTRENASLLKTAKSNIDREINAHISKLNKKLSLVNETLSEEKNLEKYKQYGELINCNIYQMQIGMEKLVTQNFYNNNEIIEIPLQKNLPPARNANLYFKKYNKLKNSISHAKEYKDEYEDEINYLNSVLFELSEVTSLFEVDEVREELINSGYIKKQNKKGKKKDLPSEPYSYEYNGVKIFAGRNNMQNDKLTLKMARKNYTWLHTKNTHGSHVIIESENVSDDLLFYAAKIAKEHSNAKNSSKVEVDYTLVKFVHKESGAKPGMVVYTDYKTIIVD